MITRNEGIDLLRILSMIMVVTLHVISASNIMMEDVTSYYYKSGWFFEIMAFCAVNCYGLISGYVSSNKSNGLHNLKRIWLLAVFYSISLTLIYFVINGVFEIKTLVKAFFPVVFDQWWYFTAFVCMSIFAPYINRSFENISGKECKQIFWAIVGIFTVVSYINSRMVISGYTIVWIICLFIMGKCIRHGNIFKPMNKILWMGLYSVLVVLTWSAKMLGSNIELVSYTSPTILFCAIALLMAFKDMRLPGNLASLVTGILAKTNFSIYLIHAHPLIWTLISSKVLELTTALKGETIFVFWIGMIAIVFFVCATATIIDYCRICILSLIKGR